MLGEYSSDRQFWYMPSADVTAGNVNISAVVVKLQQSLYILLALTNAGNDEATRALSSRWHPSNNPLAFVISVAELMTTSVKPEHPLNVSSSVVQLEQLSLNTFNRLLQPLNVLRRLATEDVSNVPP